MKILAIETSCDETAIAILECEGDPVKLGSHGARFTILGNALLSQVEIHKEYGGVYPALAKREHAKNLVPILESALEEAELLREDKQAISEETRLAIAKILEREPGLEEQFFEFVSECETPEIDAIAVTAGPGLEPALWVGINFAKALALIWDKPLVAVNHMEGHILAALARREAPSTRFAGASARRAKYEASNKLQIKNIKLSVLALLISGGHTELVLMKEWLQYELIGQTRDDAVGEAFDKVARMLGLPYPGGPEISKIAEQSRALRRRLGTVSEGAEEEHGFVIKLPRPMIDSMTCDFSFAGLKTAVLYLLKKQHILMNSRPSEDRKILNRQIAHEFENAVTEVLWKKTAQALKETGAQTLVIGGGVSANTHIRRTFKENISREFPDVSLNIPSADLTTDNAVMIALAGFYRAVRKEFVTEVTADGNLSLCQRNS